MNQTIHISCRCSFIACLFSAIFAVYLQAADHDAFDKQVRIGKNRGTIYELLKDISEQSGYFFIYDSQIIENDRTVIVAKGTYSLRDAIHMITGDDRLQLDLSGAYILLRLPVPNVQESQMNEDITLAEEDVHFTINGSLYDQQTGEAIRFASVHILNKSIGTVTNQTGEFLLIIPDSLIQFQVRFSHIGYESREIALALLKDRFVDLGMRPQPVALQEVVVTAVNPEQVLIDMLANRSRNYASEPASLISFYREGIEHNDRNIDMTESVIQVYKTGYLKKTEYDQVKLLKKRRIVSRHETDSIYPKIRSGIQSCLLLDVIKEMPDFILTGKDTPYKYAYEGKNTIDDRTVHVISFRQKDHIREPLYCGTLFIEADSKALVEVRLEINPKLVNKATNTYVNKKPFGLTMNLQEAKYIVSYRLSGNGFFYINHIRGDVSFKIRRKNRLFSSGLHFWFESATCDIHTDDVKPIPPNERLSTKRIFAETKSTYDKNFWENFNIILPEADLKNILIHHLHDVLISEP